MKNYTISDPPPKYYTHKVEIIVMQSGGSQNILYVAEAWRLSSEDILHHKLINDRTQLFTLKDLTRLFLSVSSKSKKAQVKRTKASNVRKR